MEPTIDLKTVYTKLQAAKEEVQLAKDRLNQKTAAEYNLLVSTYATIKARIKAGESTGNQLWDFLILA